MATTFMTGPRRGPVAPQPAMIHPADGPTKIDRDTFQALVLQALQLRRVHREVFILCEIKGYSIAETAGILGISEEAVTRRLRQAKGQMRLSADLTKLDDF